MLFRSRLFFRSVLSEEKYLGILQSILEDHQLTHYKIELTSSIFHQFMGDDASTKGKIILSTSSAIAAEAQLLLNFINGHFAYDKVLIEEQIIKIQFDTLGYTPEAISELLLHSKALVDSLDLSQFYLYLKEHVTWL